MAIQRLQIDGLPTELLVEVFRYYCNDEYGPVVLLLVCARWRNIAVDTRQLWGIIRFSPTRSIKHLRQGILSGISLVCSSLEALNLAITRAKNTPLDITCDLTSTCPADPVELAQMPDLSNCYRLVVQCSSGPGVEWLQLFRRLPNLEHLVLECTSEANLEGFIDEIDQNSQRIQSLAISFSFPPSLSHRPSLLRRIRCLELHMEVNHDDESRTFAGLTQLEKLTIVRGPLGIEEALQLIGAYLLSLSLLECNRMPLTRFAKLLDLQLHNDYSDFIPRRDTVCFPVLERLALHGCWQGILQVEAPRLIALILGGAGAHNDASMAMLLHQATVSPTSLSINAKVSDQELVELLQTKWPDLKDLHRKHRNNRGSIQLLTALKGSRNRPPLCPQLHSLHLETDIYGSNPEALVYRTKTLLCSVADERRKLGLGSLDVQWNWKYLGKAKGMGHGEVALV